MNNLVVIALVKLENLKAIHNCGAPMSERFFVVIALVKLENLKAIHNRHPKQCPSIMLLLH